MTEYRWVAQEGDCLEHLTWVAPGSIDTFVTDPPYLVNYRGGHGKKHRVAGDTPGSVWIDSFYDLSYKAVKDNSLSVTFYGWTHADRFLIAIRKAGFRVVSQIVFVKNQQGLGYYTRGKHEQAFLLAKGKPPIPKRALPDVLPFTRVRNPQHPNEKPQDALGPLVELCSQPGEMVCDPFMGVGSVGVAALSRDRRFLGMELDPAHFQVAQDRLNACALEKVRSLHPAL